MPERARAAHYWIDEFGSRIPGATVEIRNAANTAPITDTIYAFDDPDASVLPNPFTSDAAGKAEAYLANAKRVIFRFSKTGYTTQDVPKDFTFPANRFLYRNLWVNTTTYAANDVVRYNGESWVALRASTGVAPIEGADWSLMAAKGATQDLSAYQALSEKGQPGGYAAFNASGGRELGYAQTTTTQLGITTASTDLTGLSVTVTVATKPILVRGFVQFKKNTAGGYAQLQIKEGATVLQSGLAYAAAGEWVTVFVEVRLAPSAASHTYKLSALAGNNTIDSSVSAIAPGFIQAIELGV